MKRRDFLGNIGKGTLVAGALALPNIGVAESSWYSPSIALTSCTYSSDKSVFINFFYNDNLVAVSHNNDAMIGNHFKNIERGYYGQFKDYTEAYQFISNFWNKPHIERINEYVRLRKLRGLETTMACKL